MNFDPKTIAISDGLIELRERVLQRSTKRMPKWRFRLAPDVVLLMQPQAKGEFYTGHDRSKRGSIRFKGEVLKCEGASKDLLDDAGNLWRRGDVFYTRIELILGTDGDTWVIKPQSGGGSMAPGLRYDEIPREQLTLLRRARDARIAALLALTIEALGGPMFDVVTPAIMLSPHCLACGKALTDPASMARGIGPECAGTSSTRVRGTYLLDKMQPAVTA
jgi:uncharacterized protein DUF6011